MAGPFLNDKFVIKMLDIYILSLITYIYNIYRGDISVKDNKKVSKTYFWYTNIFGVFDNDIKFYFIF